jgi:phosphatidylinositol alpha-1,6-mannosyltransferase
MTAACGMPGGIATWNLNILRALVDLVKDYDARLTILSFLEQQNDRPDFLPSWVKFSAFQGDKLRFAGALLGMARQQPVYCFDHVTLALPVLPLAAGCIVKTIIFAHGSESWKRIRHTSCWSIQCASLCLANSHFTLRKMRERIPKFNGVACPLGLSPAFFLNGEFLTNLVEPITLRAADGETRPLSNQVLLLVARMDSRERQKGHGQLISLLPTLLQAFPDVQLVFPGPGDDRQNWQGLAQRLGVAYAVFLPGFVPIETLKQLYQQCYALVMPSKQEGFGLVYLEAMNYAKPCVGCFDDGAEDVIVHGKTGYLVRDPNDARELCGVLGRLLRDPEHAQQLGKRGFERLHKHFTAEHVQARLREQIGKVL